MARPVRPERRDELLNQLVDHLLQSGLTSFSLRPTATAVGATPRTLLYHFGSKELLEVAILEAIRERERILFAQWLTESDTHSVADVVLAVWEWLANEERRSFLRLFFEAYLASIGAPARFGNFAASAVDDWLRFLEDALHNDDLDRDAAREIATAILATLRGALLDLLATGARDRLDRLMHTFVDGLREQPEVTRRSARP
jgi:AcrR family transcriptional regulator